MTPFKEVADRCKSISVEGGNIIIKKIALANPGIASYGTAAMLAMKASQSRESVQGKLVAIQTGPQAFQFTVSEAVDAGFYPLSNAVTDTGKKGCFFMVAQAPSLVQVSCVLKGRNRPAVARFALFLISPEAELIKKKYEYR